MKLQEVHIKNFRSIHDISLNFHNFNVLIGKNNSGKTTILTAIAVLHQNLLGGKTSKELNLNEIPPQVRAQIEKLWFFGNYNEPAVISAVFQFDREQDISEDISDLSGLEKLAGVEVEVRITRSGNKVIWELSRLNILGHTNPTIVKKVDDIHNEVVGNTKQTYAKYEVLKWSLKGYEITNKKLFNEIVKIFEGGLFYIIPYVTQPETNIEIRSLISPPQVPQKILEMVMKIAKNPLYRRKLYKLLEGVTGKRVEFIPELELAKMYEGETLRFEMFGGGDQILEGVLSTLVSSNNCIFIIEEPEAHLHPDYIRGLARTLEKVAEENNCQILVVTHSPDFVGAIKEWDKITIVRQEYINTSLGTLPATRVYNLGRDKKLIEQLAFDLGISPGVFPFMDVAILVEGASDEIIISHFIQLMYHDDRLRDLCSFSWRILKYSGKGKLKAIIRTLKDDFRLPVFVIADGDKAGEGYVKEAKSCGLKLYENIFKLNEPDILCYIKNDLLMKSLEEIIDSEINSLDSKIKSRVGKLMERASENGLITKEEDILREIAKILCDNVENLKEEYSAKRYYHYLKTRITERIVDGITETTQIPPDIEETLLSIDRQISRIKGR